MGRAIWEQFYFQLFQESGDFAWSSVRCCLNLWRLHDPKEPVFLIALKIMRHAKLSFGDHVPYLRVLAPRKDVQGTVYLWAEGSSLTC